MKRGMLPEMAAQVIIDEIESDQNILNFSLLSNTPETIRGHDGFKLLYTYSDLEGAIFKTVYYGFIKGHTFFNLRFTARDRIYFQKDIRSFERMLNSFKVTDVEAGKL